MHLCPFDANQDHDIEFPHVLIKEHSLKKFSGKKGQILLFFVKSWEIYACFLSDE